MSDLLKHFGLNEESNNIKKLEEFQLKLKEFLSDGELTQEEMDGLQDFCCKNDLDLQTALSQSANEIAGFLSKLLADIVSDGTITEKEQATLDSVCLFLKPSQLILDEIQQTTARVKEIEKIKSGDIKPISSTKGIITRAGELIWCRFPNSHLLKELKNGDVMAYEGELFVLSERVVFNSYEKPIEVPLSHIVNFDGDTTYLAIAAKTQKATCEFEVENGDLLLAYIEQAINRYYRKLNLKQDEKNTRSISQSVKNSVWERDGAQCVQCQSNNYLEYDHIIPFSKGGANSEKNIQLLCRRCNSKKGNRI